MSYRRNELGVDIHLNHCHSASFGVQGCHPDFTRYTTTFEERNDRMTLWT